MELLKIIAKTLRVNENDLTDDTKMEDVDSWDSLTHMELIANIEEALGIEFTADEIVEMTDISKIKAVVGGK